MESSKRNLADMTRVWANPSLGWAYLVSVIDCCTREIMSWNLSQRCRAEDALAAVDQAVLERLPSGSCEGNLTLTTDNGNAAHFFPVPGNAGSPPHHAPPHRLPSPG